MHFLRRAVRNYASYSFIKADKIEKVGIVLLNKPEALNALSSGLVGEIKTALAVYEQDPGIHAIILGGSEKAFAGW